MSLEEASRNLANYKSSRYQYTRIVRTLNDLYNNKAHAYTLDNVLNLVFIYSRYFALYITPSWMKVIILECVIPIADVFGRDSGISITKFGQLVGRNSKVKQNRLFKKLPLSFEYRQPIPFDMTIDLWTDILTRRAHSALSHAIFACEVDGRIYLEQLMLQTPSGSCLIRKIILEPFLSLTSIGCNKIHKFYNDILDLLTAAVVVPLTLAHLMWKWHDLIITDKDALKELEDASEKKHLIQWPKLP
ncbi:hypothetical protein V1511DRAFT_507858 [Dipodascopsis uninucleata]